MKKKIIVTKASGITEPFSIIKLRNSLSRAKAAPEEIDSIIEALTPKLYQGISTKKIYSEAFRLLRNQSKTHAAIYYLKRGIMELGPTGFPFENFISEIFKHQGYNVHVREILPGKCVNHEIDVIAKKDKEIILVECKYRNQPGYSEDVKTPLYVQARFEDLLDKGLIKNDNAVFTGWIATNVKFTNDATTYSNCRGLKLFSWNYPLNNSLKDVIDKLGLYPLTCLTTITHHEKQMLLEKDLILAKDIYNNSKLLKSIGVKETRMKSIFEDGKQLCSTE